MKYLKNKNLTVVIVAMVMVAAGFTFVNAEKPDEKVEIIKFLESFRSAYTQNDFEAWSAHWKQSDEALFTIARMENYSVTQGWQNIGKRAQQVIENKKGVVYKQDENHNYHSILVDGNMAWVNASGIENNIEGNRSEVKRTYLLQRVQNKWKIVNVNVIYKSSYAPGKFVVDANQTPKETHVHLDDFPKDMVFPMITGWGGMCVDINTAPAGTDFTPLLEGLKNDHCQVPHWGYIVKGAIRMEYEDGTKEVFREGEAFYMKPGHTGGVEEDLLLVSFGPEEGIKHLVKHFEDKVAEMNK